MVIPSSLAWFASCKAPVWFEVDPSLSSISMLGNGPFGRSPENDNYISSLWTYIADLEEQGMC